MNAVLLRSKCLYQVLVLVNVTEWKTPDADSEASDLEGIPSARR
jgi:hypothetical protein